MKELKFKKIDDDDDRYRDGENGRILLKPFYTLMEKYTIYQDMKKKNDSFDRDFALIVHSARFCTNIDFEGMTDDEVYEICAENQLIEDFKMRLDEYNDMHKLVERDETVYKALDMLFDKISGKLDTMDIDGKLKDGLVALSNGKSI